MQINEFTSREEMLLAFAIMAQLRTDLTPERYEELLSYMQEEGYRMCGVFDDGRIVAVAGYAIMHNLYNQRHLWIYDLVTEASLRSRGYGNALKDFSLGMKNYCFLQRAQEISELGERSDCFLLS
jgi:hypothetical protein